MGVSKNRGTPKMDGSMENPIKMDDLGGFPLFLDPETNVVFVPARSKVRLVHHIFEIQAAPRCQNSQQEMFIKNPLVFRLFINSQKKIGRNGGRFRNQKEYDSSHIVHWKAYLCPEPVKLKTVHQRVLGTCWLSSFPKRHTQLWV